MNRTKRHEKRNRFNRARLIAKKQWRLEDNFIPRLAYIRVPCSTSNREAEEELLWIRNGIGEDSGFRSDKKSAKLHHR